ncbi:hypothetical protein EV363DRAFT_1305356, partial [Boletus edulis]
ENPFPSLANAIDGACQECLFETLAYYEDNNLELEADYYPKYKREMARLLYNDVSTYRCEIKKLVVQNIPIHYRLCPRRVRGTDAEPQALLDNWLFLRGEPDEQGKTSNFGHEGLKYVALVLFYSNTSKSFASIPGLPQLYSIQCTALVAAFVQVVLGIFADYGYVPRNLKIDVNKLKDSYDKLQRTLTRLTMDDYHGAKLDKMLEDWATIGMTGYSTAVVTPHSSCYIVNLCTTLHGGGQSVSYDTVLYSTARMYSTVSPYQLSGAVHWCTLYGTIQSSTTMHTLPAVRRRTELAVGKGWTVPYTRATVL